MPNSYFSLRWESTNDQWWYATPIDWAAANGHIDLVKHLLHIDPNLLIKLSSLPRIRRLETVWDDTDPNNGPARCRARVAKSLLLGCEPKGSGGNSLIRAGYGGWILYTAASGGDVGFVKDLLERDPLAVFGEGEYGFTDILYGAARSKNSEVFRLLFKFAIKIMASSCYGDTETGTGTRTDMGIGKENGNSPKFKGEFGCWDIPKYPNRHVLVMENDNCLKVQCIIDGDNRGSSEVGDGFLWEIMNRAVHVAAKGGNLEVLKELLLGGCDVLSYRDAEGSTVLHSATARGQVEVVKHLIATYDIIHSTDNQGNTALHVAAYKGHSPVVDVLALASPSLSTLRNNDGDTFLHMAVSGFASPGFHRIDQQMKLMKQLVNSKVIILKDIINVRNNEGRTALHIAVAENINCNVVELLMTVGSIDLNLRDVDGFTPLDLLKQCPKTGVIQGIGSPGTYFRYPDADLFLYTGNVNENDSESENNLESFNLTPLRHKSKRLTPPRSSVYSANCSPSSTFSSSLSPTSLDNKLKVEGENGVRSSFFSGSLSSVRSQKVEKHRRIRSFNKSLMNQYFCFGGQGLAVQDSVTSTGASRSCSRRLVF